MRIDLSSLGVFGLALAASLSVAFWIHRLDDRGVAYAEPIALAPTATPHLSTAAAPVRRPAQVLKASDGHYWAEARIEGRAVRVLVDTGASVVALTREDAARLGLRPQPSEFTARVETASGAVSAAPATLSSVSVGGAEVRDVQALVVEQGLPYSLLGMSYLGRLSSLEATPSGLTLRP